MFLDSLFFAAQRQEARSDHIHIQCSYTWGGTYEREKRKSGCHAKLKNCT